MRRFGFGKVVDRWGFLTIYYVNALRTVPLSHWNGTVSEP